MHDPDVESAAGELEQLTSELLVAYERLGSGAGDLSGKLESLRQGVAIDFEDAKILIAALEAAQKTLQTNLDRLTRLAGEAPAAWRNSFDFAAHVTQLGDRARFRRVLQQRREWVLQLSQALLAAEVRHAVPRIRQVMSELRDDCCRELAQLAEADDIPEWADGVSPIDWWRGVARLSADELAHCSAKIRPSAPLTADLIFEAIRIRSDSASAADDAPGPPPNGDALAPQNTDRADDGRVMPPASGEAENLLTEVVVAVLEGNLLHATERWKVLLDLHQRHLRGIATRIRDEVWIPLGKPGQDQTDSERHNLVLQFFEELTDTWAGCLGHLLRRRSRLLEQRGRLDESFRAFRQIFALDAAFSSLSEREVTKLLSFIQRSRVSESFRAEIPAESPGGTKLLTILEASSQVEKLGVFLHELEAADSTSAADWRSGAERLSQAYRELPKMLQEVTALVLVDAYKLLQRRRATWRHMGPESRSEEGVAEITQGMLALNDVLRARSIASPRKRFDDLYDYYECLRLQPDLVARLGRRESLQDALRAAWGLGHEVLQSASSRSELEKHSGLNSFFLSRLGEIGRAFVDFEVVPSSELPLIVTKAVEFFQEALAFSKPPDPRHVGNNCPRIGECFQFLRRYEDAISYFERVAFVGATASAKERERAWDARRRISICRQKLGERALRAENLDEANQWFDSAVEWLCRAAEIWERRDPRTGPCTHPQNRTLGGSLAWLCFVRGDYRAAQAQAAWVVDAIAADTVRLSDARSRALFVLGMSRWYLQDPAGAAGALETLLAEAPLPIHRLKPLIALRDIYESLGDASRAQDAADRFESACRTLGRTDLPRLPAACQRAFLNSREMSEYVNGCIVRLKEGATRELLRELAAMTEAAPGLNSDGQANGVLFGLLARTQRGVGDWDGAVASLRLARQAEPSERNRAHCFFQEGQIYLDLENYSAAAEAFANCRQSDPEYSGAWLLGARAFRLAGEFNCGLRLLYELIHSGRDEQLSRSLTERARIYWERYRTSGQEADVASACRDIDSVIFSQGSAGGYRSALKLLAEIADHVESWRLIAVVLDRATSSIACRLIRDLADAGRFAPKIQAAVFDTFRRSDLDTALTRAVGQYTTACWVDAYFHSHDLNCESAVRATTAELWARTSDSRMWSDLLAASKNIMTNRIRRELDRMIRLSLRPVFRDPEAVLTHYRDHALPQLNAALDTRLHALTPANYLGREPGVSLLDEALKWLDCWPVTKFPNGSDLGLLIDTRLIADETDRYEVSAFQQSLARVVLQTLIGEIARSIPAPMFRGEQAIALGLTRDNDQILVQLRIAFSAEVSAADCQAVLARLNGAAQLDPWRIATQRFLPTTLALEFRPQSRDGLFTLSLRACPRSSQEFWPWREFFEITAGTNSERSLPDYFSRAAEAFPADASLDSLQTHVLVHLDGRFASSFQDTVDPLLPKLHTAKHFVDNSIKIMQSDHPDLEAVAENLRASSAALLEIEAVYFEDFELNAMLRNLLTYCRSFWSGSGIEFELRAGLSGPHSVVTGSEDHIRQALLDVIFNAVAAIRQESNPSGRVRITVIPEQAGLRLLCENTGAPTLPAASGGHGIGSRNIARVFVDLHHGTVAHGPSPGNEPFNYAWNLFLPLQATEED